MSAALVAAVPPWPKALGVALVIAVASLGATPAFAAPEWGITMTHANAYGLQASECPSGHEEDFPGEPQKDCGVDPFTGSGTTFARESGFNAYTIVVKNTGDEATGTIVGKRLTCETGAWYEEPTFAYQWLRDGVAIPGATAGTYTLTAADEGTAIQCDVTGENSGGATSFPSSALLVSPESATEPPVSTRPPEVSEAFEILPVGEVLDCTSGSWEGSPSFSYQWLRDGVAIPGATSDEYTTTAGDQEASLQCQVTATNARGSVIANTYPVLVKPEPQQFPPYTERAPGPSIQGSGTGNATVSVSDQLPDGLVLAGRELNDEVSGEGWTCPIPNPSTVTCTRTDALSPGASYPPITFHVHIDEQALLGTPPSGGVTDVATVYGGEASPASASASDPTTIALVPFGIHNFSTSVTESLGNPFTQADGHPFAANATFIFNYVPDDGGNLKTVGGSPKDIETELPPGLLGDPQSTPKCPVTTFETQDTEAPCPPDTAVGYIHFSYSQGTIVGGHPEPGLQRNVVPIYNLVPALGHPAAFGFIGGKSYAHFTLNAKLRSDGDYGITISSPDTATPTLLAASPTFCENGSTISQQGGSVVAVACTPPDSGSTPFLTNPSECSSTAPVTLLSADTYEDPGVYASMTSYAGAASAPPSFVGQPGTSGTPSSSSFVTGCSDLRFYPEVVFKPSPPAEGGTTQADEPTGATFALKVPQPEEDNANATPELKDATVTLPAGMTVDPAAADGLRRARMLSSTLARRWNRPNRPPVRGPHRSGR